MKTFSRAALTALLVGPIAAFAQTTTSTVGSSTPGTPATGMGGLALSNTTALIVATAAIVVGALYLRFSSAAGER